MNSEKVKEIKEKLKKQYYYLDQAYSDHLAYGGKGDEQQEEEIYFLGDILTYINELESENERLRLGLPKTKARIVAPIYVMPNVETPEMILKLGEKNLLQQFAERLKEQMGVREYMGVKYKQGVFSENDIYEILNSFMGEKFDNEEEE